MFYIVRQIGERFVLGSYLTEANCHVYAPGEVFYEDTIMSQEVGFPVAGRLVRGYSLNPQGQLPENSAQPADNCEFEQYARNIDGDWVLVEGATSYSLGKFKSNYAESIVLAAFSSPKLQPRELLTNLEGAVVPMKTLPVKGDLNVQTRGVYDD